MHRASGALAPANHQFQIDRMPKAENLYFPTFLQNKKGHLEVGRQNISYIYPLYPHRILIFMMSGVAPHFLSDWVCVVKVHKTSRMVSTTMTKCCGPFLQVSNFDPNSVFDLRLGVKQTQKQKNSSFGFL